jgi:signal transduction histidine kinase
MTTYQIKEEHHSLFSSALNFLSYSAKSQAHSFDIQKKNNHVVVSNLTKCENAAELLGVNDRSSQQEFINSIIHELKTPLNAIVGFSDALKDDLGNPELVKECQEYIKEINNAAMDLNDLIHDLLDVGFGVGSGNFSVDLSLEVDVENIVTRSVRLNHDYALGRHIGISKEISANLKSIKLDAKRTKQILTNLISNAIKYSPNNSEVKIFADNIVENNKEFLQIIVSDQGFGMNTSQVETAFQKYQTIQNPNSGKVDSFGLGLPIVKQLVELQNGEIFVKSEVGKGTEVIIKFPYLKQ